MTTVIYYQFMTIVMNKWTNGRAPGPAHQEMPLMTTNVRSTALVTGASSGIGATYADRLARRGHDLVLVARDKERLEALAAGLRADTGVVVDVLPADLTAREDLRRVEERLREDARIGLLINNAGANVAGGFAAPDLDRLEALIQLNVTALTRLAGAAVPPFLARGGAIVNIASVLAYVPELLPGIYSATKAYVVNFSRALQTELGERGLYVQAVLPAATRTEIWERSGRSIDDLPPGTVMNVDELVDAALVGFDRREPITIPSLPDFGQWEAFDAARLAMAANFGQEHAAQRYRQG